MTDYMAEGEKKVEDSHLRNHNMWDATFYGVYDFGTGIFHNLSLCSNNVKVNVVRKVFIHCH